MLKPDSNSLGWGRAAAMRFVKSEEEIKADIIKALEGKLSVEFQDYSQWQRKTTGTDTSVTSRPSTKTTLKPKSVSSAVSSSKCTTISSNCSTLCLHPWTRKDSPVDRTAENEKNNRIAILKAQITSKKNSVLEYLKLRKTLRKSNEAMKTEIVSTENRSQKAVTDLLEKFEKYSSAAIVLADKHALAVNKATNEYRDIEASINGELDRMERARAEVDEKLQGSESELQMLRTYKDKVYPERALTIAKLQSVIQNQLQDQKAEENDLDRIIRGEKALFDVAYNAQAGKVIEGAAENALHFSALKNLDRAAENNIRLMHEIRLQKHEIDKIEAEISVLTDDVNRLRSTNATNVKKHVFPEIFAKAKKCSPDEDVVLDIPTRQFIPI